MKIYLKWAGISFLAVVLAFIAINLFDESLDPRAGAYGKPRAPKIPDVENGYFALLAIDAPKGVDGMTYAKAWLDEARAAANEGRRPKRPERVQAKRSELCDPREKACVSAADMNVGQLARQLEPFNSDLVRYDALVSFNRFEEILDYPFGLESDFPAYGSLAQAQRAYLLRIALDLEAGRVEKAISALEREFAWQRLFLSESRLLVSKMVAAASYWRDLMFVRNLIEARPAKLAPFLPRLKTMLRPLDAPMQSLPQVAETEFAFVRAAYSKIAPDKNDIGQLAGWYLGGTALLYHPNATVNSAYRYYSALASSVFVAPAHQVASEWSAFSQSWHGLPWWRLVYNPIGKMLMSVAMPAWEDYPLRMHDLDALNRLVALRVELLVSKATAGQIAERVAASDRRFHDPYSRNPMTWDGERKRLYFEARSKRIKELKNGVESGRVFVNL